MGKKLKKGKNRLDKYYWKARDAGYRARSAYKLLQLNQKYQFFQRSRVCIDLCAAPGSWMQIAQKFMPVSSVIIGVDLVPIKPITNAITIQGDITTDKTRMEIKATIKTWKADLILHDGAPNIGQNWIHDAYQQNLLVLSAFKLACEFLQKGGWFISKVFRSRDYHNLEYVFRKLFKNVEATKPHASRRESAEIFVICRGYLAPDKIDSEYFNPRFVFQELDPEPKQTVNLLKPSKIKKKAEGYEEGITVLHKKVPVSEFIHSSDFLKLLQQASELEFDDEKILNHQLSTVEVQSCCKDIRVLGRRELRLLLRWRLLIKDAFEKDEEKTEKKMEETPKAKETTELTAEEMEIEELQKLQEEIMQLNAEVEKDKKRTKKKARKELRKLKDRVRLRGLAADQGPTEKDSGRMFRLSTITDAAMLDKIVDVAPRMVLPHVKSKKNSALSSSKMKFVKFNRDEEEIRDDSGRITGEACPAGENGAFVDSSLKVKKKKKVRFQEDEPENDEEIKEIEEELEEKQHPLLTDLDPSTGEEKVLRKAENFFKKDIFNDLDNEDDEDYELQRAVRKLRRKGGILQGGSQRMTQKGEEDEDEAPGLVDAVSDSVEPPCLNGDVHLESSGRGLDADNVPSDSDSDHDSDSASDDGTLQKDGPYRGVNPGKDFGKKRKKNLTPAGLALATKMIYSKKAKRDIMDASWNRYMFDEDDSSLPDWFVQDEMKHNRPQIEVESEDITYYQDRSKPVDARNIKKVVQAKARKQRLLKRRLEKTRKKVEGIVDNPDMTQKEKSQEVKNLYKKALAPLKKKEKKYVVMKKRRGGTKPKGIKGPYKLVDKRLKKDVKAKLRVEQKRRGTKKTMKKKKRR